MNAAIDPELLDMLVEAQSADGGGESPLSMDLVPTRSAVPIKKVSYTHAGMIDMIIAHPEWSQDLLARHFGYSATWISNIIQSDAFQSALALRKDEIIDPVLRQTVEDQFKGMVARSLEIIRHHLNKPAQDVPVTVAMKALEISAKAAGYGAKTERPPDVGVHIHLESMADRLSVLLHKKRAEPAIEGDFSEKS